VKCWIKIAALLLSVVAIRGSAQSAPAGQVHTSDTQVRGVWTDPSTGLMWAGKDNGKDVGLKSAVKYCRDLRLAGYSDWRLANMAELQGIYDKSANAPGLAGPHDNDPTMWHVKGNLFLTGYEWAFDPGWRSSGYHSYFDFPQGKPEDEETGFLYSPTFIRALCVRGSAK